MSLAAICVAVGLVGGMRLEADETGATTVPAGVQSPDDEEVLRAIQRGVDFLLKDMQTRLEPARNVPESQLSKPTLLNSAGEFTLEAYALLHAGRDLKDPRLYFRDDHMSLAVNVLEHQQIDHTYTTALQCLALAELPQLPEVKDALGRAAKRLVAGTGTAGGYTYTLENPGRDAHDQSNSQYGLLGVWAAADWGIDISPKYWKETDNFWRTIQNEDGGWSYGGGKGEASTLTMTAAGVASLIVCQDFMDRTPVLERVADSAMDNGVSALARGFDPESDNLYYMYGVERVGLASGTKYLGNKNWYRLGAAKLLKLQHEDGSFGGSMTGGDPAVLTSYALLFLMRGRAPVAINKLEYDGPWNARLRDVANATKYLERAVEKHLNWQAVPLDVAFEEWLDAPVLLITGSKDPAFSDDDVAKLQAFVNAGGLIASVTQGNSRKFDEAMKRYAIRIGPGADAWRQLPADHPLFTVYSHPKEPPELYGVSNGLRELWIHCPADFDASWQIGDFRSKLRRQAWELPAQLVFYAAGKEGLRSKLDSLVVPALPADAGSPKQYIKMVELERDGNWNPEPAAWPRLARMLANRGVVLSIDHVKATALAAMADKPVLVHLAGTGKLQLTEDEQQALKIYVLSGGTLFVEALGGDADFRTSAEEMLTKLFSDAKLKTVPANYLLYTGAFSKAATPIEQVEYRKWWVLKNGSLATPRLQYMTLEKRVGVLFSAEDITSGLLGTDTWGISGYTPRSAVALARNIVLFADINMPRHAATQERDGASGK
ncbi:MAG TPA: DUF4159 domain-containing protein [Phycisphaerae bacterium]|nr:DUF4159 domain-containing protein [Phycisphaerae bacterium]